MTDKNPWIELMEAHNYPLPDLTNFDFTEYQIINKKEMKEYFSAAKNSAFCKKKSAAVCITIHEPWKYYESPAELEQLLRSWEDEERVNFFEFALEVGKENKTFHLQGYLRFAYNNRPYYKAILKKLNTVNANIISAKGSPEQNINYIEKDESKDENNKIQKWLIKSSDYEATTLKRRNFDCSEFVDYAIKHHININNRTMDLYCRNYRQNPQNAKSVIAELYNTRISDFKDDAQILQHLTFCGNSGSGKSLITEYLLKRIGAKISQEVVKMEANKGRERLFFNKDASLQRICWFTEMTWYFPNKTHLLSLLDRQSSLEVKGKDSVPNMFDILLLNSTGITPFTIYNFSQNNNNSYTEIARRLADYGKTFFIFPNEKWKQKELLERQELLKKDYLGTVEKYPPLIYEFTPKKNDYKNGELYPDCFINLSLELPERHKSKLNTTLSIEENTVIENIKIMDLTYCEALDYAEATHEPVRVKDFTSQAFVKYRVTPRTLNDVYSHFINVLKSVNSTLLNLKKEELTNLEAD